MKKYIIVLVLLVTGIFTSCNSSRNIANSEPKSPTIITETVVTIPEAKVPEPIEEVEEAIEEVEEMAVEEVIEDSTQQEEEEVIEVPEVNITVDHTGFDTMLRQHVSPQGNVNYDGIKSNWGALRAYIKSLDDTMPTAVWTQEEKLAYWMNAYNAMTIDLILRNYPLKSIKDIKDPWDQRFWKLGNKWYNLNEIEHEILRKMGDARIHFGINCASFSCPPLLNEAFTAEKVGSQLDMLSRTFINDPKRNTITSDRVEVSKIFTWFAKDFKTNGSLVDFLNTYSETTISPNAKVRYMDYDWALNE